MKQEITIVTAFFDLKRENWSGFSRSRKDYLDYFSFWARLQNKVVIYTDAQMAEEAMRIRKDFGLEQKTCVVIVNDAAELDNPLLRSMQEPLKRRKAVDWRIKPNNPESHNAYYNYSQLMKSWCVCDAIEKGYASGMIAWMDFGYNNAGNYYKSAEEFDFLWQTELSRHIHIFTLQPLDDEMPIFEVVRRMDTYIQGGLVIAPAEYWQKLWPLERQAMLALNAVGLCDDDQTILLMVYRQNPALFCPHPCNWYEGLLLSGCAENLKTHAQPHAQPVTDTSLYGRYAAWCAKREKKRIVTEYLRREKKSLADWDPK